MQIVLRTLMISLWFYCITSSHAGTIETAGEEIVSPDNIEGTTIVDAEALIATVVATPGLVLIDSRIPADRNDGYIEGSVSLPDTDTNCDSLASRVPATATPVMFYCNGIKCGRSAKAAKIAVDCGYSNVYWFRNGMEEWLEEQYPLVR